MQQEFPDLIIDIRGIGLMQGIELSALAAPFIALCLKKGLLLVSAGTHIIRFVPPLTVTADEVSEMLAILRAAFIELNQ